MHFNQLLGSGRTRKLVEIHFFGRFQPLMLIFNIFNIFQWFFLPEIKKKHLKNVVFLATLLSWLTPWGVPQFYIFSVYFFVCGGGGGMKLQTGAAEILHYFSQSIKHEAKKFNNCFSRSIWVIAISSHVWGQTSGLRMDAMAWKVGWTPSVIHTQQSGLRIRLNEECQSESPIRRYHNPIARTKVAS